MRNQYAAAMMFVAASAIAASAAAQPTRGTHGEAPAQIVGAGAPVAPGTMVNPGKALDDMITPFEQSLLGVVEEMPADKFDFKPAPGIFQPSQNAAYETIMSFSAEVKHLTSANYYFYSSATGMCLQAST